MKRIITQVGLCSFLALLFHFSAYSQPDYSFTGSALISGTPLQNNAVYKFTSAKPGVDANVKIISQVGGVTLSEIDNNGTGFNEALQPFINVQPNANGYVE
ncbi:MAG: hypothetical protein FJY20_08670 [Bacteroidetes bacterium]|nr:hypothetical protein [Bacteroidota bacterium]